MPELHIGEVGKVVVSSLFGGAVGYAVDRKKRSSKRKVGPFPSASAVVICQSLHMLKTPGSCRLCLVAHGHRLSKPFLLLIMVLPQCMIA